MLAATAQVSLPIGLFKFTIAPLQPLVVPALNKANMLRGGFGHAFRRLCCVPECKDSKTCPLGTSCPYKAVFEPSPPSGADRLSKNQDIPRPFVFRAPQTQQTRFEPGQQTWIPAGVVVSPLERQSGGLEAGDVIVSINGRSLESWEKGLFDLGTDSTQMSKATRNVDDPSVWSHNWQKHVAHLH